MTCDVVESPTKNKIREGSKSEAKNVVWITQLSGLRQKGT